ncbi:CHAT domain-containing protein [Microscilla marina]|uniref:Tetratricopeptide repeat domain protein n=1 Tax=Microscilla marina ATCC 23134 TaxID=313606 RepID=A1ZKP8_MICM2|nr:CHAT domain-containing tetratricopeptide repeat protein [Microscilla marina]EAY28864.1 tetratricopeptide repeat domain protein [Microscilla marina ATCC 23134]
MKTWIIFLLALLSFNATHGQTKVDTLEAHRLVKEGKKLLFTQEGYKALKKLQQASNLFKAQGFEIQQAKCIMYQLYCYGWLTIHNPKVLLKAEYALKIFQKHKDFFNVAKTYAILGGHYADSGIDIDKALFYYQKSIAIYQKNGYKMSVNVAWLWNSIGNIYMVQKKYKKAVTCFEKSHQMLQKLLPVGDARLGYYFSNMSLCFRAQKKYDVAIKYLRQAGKYSKGRREGYYSNLGDLYLFQSRLILSEQYYLKALALAKKRYNGRHQNIGGIYESLARLSIEKKDYFSALKRVQKGLSYLVSNFIDTLDIYHHTSVRNSKHPYMYLYLLLHKAKAFSLFSDSLKDLKASLYNYQLYDSVTIEVQSQSNHRNYYFSQKIYPEAIQVCQRLYAKTQDKKYQHLAFYFAQRSHVNVLAKSVQTRRAQAVAQLPDSLVNQEMYLKQQRAYYQQKALTASNARQKTAYQDSIFRVLRQQDMLNEAYAQKFPKYYRLRFQSKPATVPQIQQKLDSQSVVLSYVWGKEQSHVLAITRDNFQVYTLPPQKQVTAALNAYYNALQQAQRLPVFARKSYQAYQCLLAPLQKLLRTKQKIIVTNPTLLSVPLEALVTQPYQSTWGAFGQLPYLAKQHTLSYHYSASLWWQNERRPSLSIKRQRLHFAGFAPFSGGKGQVMTTRANEGLLPESKAEVSAVYNFFKQKKHEAAAYLSKAATRREFLRQVSKLDILHIASHSTANLREARLARIHFAPQPQADSTYLYAESIYYLPLKAQLVVLSSCESGVGKFEAGEGVMSLARGFLHAGAQSVVSSLWEADDVYTKKLMILFYNQALFGQVPYSRALGFAKRHLLSQEPTLHPKYWSNFILIGR